MHSARPSRQISLLFAAIGLLSVHAWLRRFIQDDAFISFRYAANAVAGDGLVWNPGERVEGYTNFLWTVVMTIPAALGWDPIHFSQILGVCLFAGTLLVAYRVSGALLDSIPVRFALLLVLGTHSSFVSYATGGLETQLQTLIATAGVGQSLMLATGRRPTAAWLAWQSGLWGLGFLNRLDTVVLALPSILWVVASILRDSDEASDDRGDVAAVGGRSLLTKGVWIRLACFAGPVLSLLTPWAIWKIGYYGALLPNTFEAKVGEGSHYGEGALYLWSFVKSYGLAPILLLLPFAVVGARAKLDGRMALLGATVALWIVYVARVGGDFMEFRFLVPIIPLFLIGVASLVVDGFRSRFVAAGVAAWLVAGSVHHSTTFSFDGRVESVSTLDRHVAGEGENWIQVGRVLGDLFEDAEDRVTIATTAAGAIPFYSKLHSIDMLGLNDRWVAKNGAPFRDRSGHRKIAPVEYLIQRRVHLVLGHPQVVRRGVPAPRLLDFAQLARSFLLRPDPELLARASVLAIPLDEKWQLMVVYLTRSPAVESLIARGEAQRYGLTGLAGRR